MAENAKVGEPIPAIDTILPIPPYYLVDSSFPERIRVLAWSRLDGGALFVRGVGTDSGTGYERVLTPEAASDLNPHEWRLDFKGNAKHFQLAIEAHRLDYASSYDPLFALNNAAVDALPHQLEAVYEYMLPQPRIRHLMAHDAGAGKTIMGGLIFRELAGRNPRLRTLVVSPAGLTRQWQRELKDKFLSDFQILDRDAMAADETILSKNPRLITSIAFARQDSIRRALAAHRWDFIFVDEAHHLAAYKDRETQAYKLGKTLSECTEHLVLATATPHKGDTENFLRLLQLLDPDVRDPAIVSSTNGQRGSALMLRRLKEEMVDFDGKSLFKRRTVQTELYSLRESATEFKLYCELTDYVRTTFHAAEKLDNKRRSNVRFAMTLLQRRMASSLAALRVSLEKRRSAILDHPHGIEAIQGPSATADLIEELDEHDRWNTEESLLGFTPFVRKAERAKELSRLEDLLRLVNDAAATAEEVKARKLLTLIHREGISLATGEKLLVFTEFKDTLDYLVKLLTDKGFVITTIHGDMAFDERITAEKFFRENAQILVATEAAGEGINLQFCSKMVNYDIPWLPTRLEQRMGRIHRYGQKNDVFIYNLVTKDTREGHVLVKMLGRLNKMREHLGDQVFDVISDLVSDVNVEQSIAGLSFLADEDMGHHAIMQAIDQALAQGQERYLSTLPNPYPIDSNALATLKRESLDQRLTPEYAQHFMIQTSEALGAEVVSIDPPGVPPGDALVFELRPRTSVVAAKVGIKARQAERFSFRYSTDHVTRTGSGETAFESIRRVARTEWDADLVRGAVFLDLALPPGESYRIWFFATDMVDGLCHVVSRRVFAVRENANGELQKAKPSCLIDLIPNNGFHAQPPNTVADDARKAWKWSIANEQLPLLRDEKQRRMLRSDWTISSLRMDAEHALSAAENRRSEASFGDSEMEYRSADRDVRTLTSRLNELANRSLAMKNLTLGNPVLLGFALVVPDVDMPSDDLKDFRPEVAAAAQKLVMEYEAKHGRLCKDVSGEHRDYPYDLLSEGPGGTRCIEVKGTVTGNLFMSENERRAAVRYKSSYFLYIVESPLSDPVIRIIQDPLRHMQPDEMIRSNTRYLFKRSTWHPVAEQGAIT